MKSVSWCDKLASVPSVGFRFDHRFLPVEAIIESWQPILNMNAIDGQAKFQLTRIDDFHLEINAENGFKYAADPSRVSVVFNHRMKIKNVSGAAPRVDMLSTPQPYTRLLPDVLNRLTDCTMLLPKIKDRNLLRVGIGSTTPVDVIDAPPGIQKFLDYMGRPWKGGLQDGFSIQVTTNVGTKKAWVDRCIHTLLRSEVGDEVMIMTFDYQRIFNEPKAVNRETLQEVCAKLENDALGYFEELAEGNMFDDADRETIGAA